MKEVGVVTSSSSTAAAAAANAATDSTATTTASDSNRNSGCGIYLAPSSIPFSGLGMYVGNASFSVNDIVATQDVVIPIVDRDKHTGYINERWLFDEYIWNAGKEVTCFVFVCFFFVCDTRVS